MVELLELFPPSQRLACVELVCEAKNGVWVATWIIVMVQFV